MRISILGGTGFLAKELLLNLYTKKVQLDEFLEVTLLSRNPPSNQIFKLSSDKMKVNWLHFDRNNITDQHDFIKGDFLIDAAMSTVPEYYLYNNIKNICDVKSPIEKYTDIIENHSYYAYLSSGAVYGALSIEHYSLESEAFTEVAEQKRNNYPLEKRKYSQLKILDENFLLREVQNHKEFIQAKKAIFRIFSVAPLYAHSNRHFALLDFLRGAERGCIEYNSHGRVYRSFLQSDHLWKIIFDKSLYSTKTDTFNLCGPAATNLFDVAQDIAKFFDCHFVAPNYNPKIISDFYGGSNSHLYSCSQVARNTPQFCTMDWVKSLNNFKNIAL